LWSVVAATNNAAMIDPPKRNRRRFQFRLRTLMIVVTLLAVPLGYVGWSAKIVRERIALRESSPFCESKIVMVGIGTA
jgi:hypothetical protein